jgi:hypothetical protein
MDFEGINLFLFSLKTDQKSYFIAGDTLTLNNTMNSIVSQQTAPEDLRMRLNEDGFSLMRSFRYIFNDCSNEHDFFLEWSCKLESSLTSQDRSNGKLKSLGYEWFVIAYSIDGSYREVSKGKCEGFLPELSSKPISSSFRYLIKDRGEYTRGNEEPEINMESEKEIEKEDKSEKTPWNWEFYSIDLPGGLRSDDLIVLFAKCISVDINFPSHYFRKCSVVTKDFKIKYYAEDEREKEKAMKLEDEHHSGLLIEDSGYLDFPCSSVYSVFNDIYL